MENVNEIDYQPGPVSLKKGNDKQNYINTENEESKKLHEGNAIGGVPKKNTEEDMPRNINIESDEDIIKQRTHWENLIYFLFTFLFITAIFLQLNVTNNFKSKDTIYQFINTPINVFDYVDFDAPDNVMKKIMTNITSSNFTFGDKKFEVIGSIRLTVRRLKNIEKEMNPLIKNLPYEMFGPDVDPEIPMTDDENKNSYGRDKFRFNFTRENSYKDYGGYVITFNKSDFYDSSNRLKTDQIDLYNKMFDEYYNFDENTSSFVFDFTVINRELNYVIVVVISYYLSTYGNSYGYFTCNIIDNNLFSGPKCYFRTFLELLSFVILFYYTFYLCFTIKKRIDVLSKRDLLDRQDTNNKGENLISEPKLTDENKKIIISRKQFLKYLAKAILSSIPSIFQIISLAISLFCLIFWGIFAIKFVANSNTINNAINIGQLELRSQNSLIFLAESLRTYQSLLLFNFLICFLRLVNVFVQFFTSSQIFLDTLSNAAGDILSFMAFFVTVVFGFAVFCMIYYGRNILQFGDLYLSCQNILSYSLGFIEMDLVEKMVNYSVVTTLLFFLCVIISLRLIVTKVLLAIILHYFTVSYDEEEFRKEQIEKNKVLTHDGIGRSYVAKVIESFKYACINFKNILCCNKKISLNKILEDSPKINAGEHENNKKFTEEKFSPLDKENYNKISQDDDDDDDEDSKDLREFNKYYEEDYIFSLKNPYFDAEKDKVKLKEYYEDKNRKIFLKSLLFMCFLICLILKNMFSTLSPWMENYFTSIEKFYADTGFDPFKKMMDLPADSSTDVFEVRNFVFDTFPNSFNYITTDRYTPNPDAYQIYDFMKKEYKITDTVKLSLPKSSKKSFYIMRYNTLVQDKILVTIKKSKESIIFKNAREQGPISVDSMSQENNTDISLGSYLFKYNYDKSYNNLGGYTYQMDLQTWRQNPLPLDVQSLLIDEMLQYVVLEFIFENTDYSILVYNTITILADVGAYKKVSFSASQFNYMPFDNWLDKIAIITELIFAAFLVYLIFDFFYSIKIRSKKYEQWYRDTVRNLRKEIRDLREYHLPENLRKLFMVFGFDTLYDLFLLGFSCWLIFLSIRYYSLQFYISDLYNSLSLSTLDIYEIRATIYDAVDIRNTYLNLSCILIFCNSIRILNSLKLGGYFTLLISTLKRSQYGNISFLIILVLILPGYVIYKYLAFGDNLIRYSTMSNTIVDAFVALFGQMDFMELYNAENFFGPIIIINFSFLINMLLVNCFVAVIYVSYRRIKETFIFWNEKFSIKRTFLFCCYRNRGILTNRNKRIVDEDMIFSLNSNCCNWNPELKISDLDENFETLDIEVVKFKRFNDEINLTEEKLTDFRDAYECKKLNVLSSITKDYNYPDVDSKHLKIYEVITLKKYLDYSSAIKSNNRDLENEIAEAKYQHQQNINSCLKKDSNIRENSISLESEEKIKKEIEDLTRDIDELKAQLELFRKTKY